MNTEQFIQNLKKRASIQFEIGQPASNQEIFEVEKKTGVKFPEQIKWFYQACNGLKAIDPALEIRPLSDLAIDRNKKIDFALFNRQHILSFDVSSINEAGQWNIINSKTEFKVTKSMASFWSNKIFAWLDNRRPIWQEEVC